MGITADRHGWRIDGTTARVAKTMTTSGVRKIALLEVWVTLPGDLGADQRSLLQRSGEGCPVKRSLEGAVPMEIHWL
jgi:putative redox protein